METVGWILAIVIACAFVGAGAMKLVTPYEELAHKLGVWVHAFTPGQIKLLAAAEILGAVGVIVPWVVDVAPVLSPIAALCLGAIMIGASVVHARQGEKQEIAVNTILLALCVALAVIRFNLL